jgi:hypothetical protein
MRSYSEYKIPVHITGSTMLVGVPDYIPLDKSGNYCTIDINGVDHSVYNMYMENLEYCMGHFIDDGLINIRIYYPYMGFEKCSIYDERIPEEFYMKGLLDE